MAKEKPKKPAAKKPAAKGNPPDAKPKPAPAPRSDYNAFRDDQAVRSRERSEKGREIGEIPAVVNPERRARGERDPEFFNKAYFPSRFYLGFGPPHREAMATLAQCTLNGGLFAFAMQRGGGKTQITECEVIRAILYGLRRYVIFLAATQDLADNSVAKIFRELETNDLLLEDFPEVCYPVRRLDRINQRAKGQTVGGEATRMLIKDNRLVLPAIAGSRSSGSAIEAFGLTGAFKGRNLPTPGGEIIRPDMVVIDDAQTRESAASPTQTAHRERLILDDVIGLAGPTTEIAVAFVCTPIYPKDLTMRFIDREARPEWRGKRTRMIEEFPAAMELWHEYHEVRADGMRDGDEGRAGNEFYAARRAEMDAGCVLAWPDRRKPNDLSAVQTAMNLFLTNPTGFASEYQCDPPAEAAAVGAKELVAADLLARDGGLSGLPRGVVRREATHLTAFVDPGGGVGRGIWFAVCDWDPTFGGSVVDYGVWPQQQRRVFAGDDLRPGLAELYPGLSAEQRLFRGLQDLAAAVLGRAYRRQDTGEELRVDRCLIDAGWQSSTVYQFIRQSHFAASIFPSKGVGRSNTQSGVAAWRKRDGERRGFHWRLTVNAEGKGRMVQFDPDAWKSFVYERLTTPGGGGANLVLFGQDPRAHELIAEHLAAEASTLEPHRGAVFDKWKKKVGNPDNHWLDCVVGCAVAAGVLGLEYRASGVPEARKARKKLDIEALYAAANGSGG